MSLALYPQTQCPRGLLIAGNRTDAAYRWMPTTASVPRVQVQGAFGSPPMVWWRWSLNNHGVLK